MAMRALLFISSLLLFNLGIAQELDSLNTDPAPSLDSLEISRDTTLIEPEDTIQIPRKFLTVAPYLDLGKLLTIPLDFETKYEGGIELRFLERFSLYGEAGSATTAPEAAYTNGVYESTGTYYRIGAGIVGPLDPEHDIGISFRYGASVFEESGSIFIDSPSEGQGSFVQRINRTDLTARWWEIVFYSDRKLFKKSDLLWLGLNIRLRILESYDQQETPDVYAIPGYGRAFDKTIPSANFFLKIKF